MDFSSQIVPAVIVLVGNLLSGKHGSSRWEKVTAVFGWAAAVSLVAYFLAAMLFPGSTAKDFLLQILCFSLLTALSRDYERILHPLFNRDKQ
jgi:hypothetical protein